MISIITCTKDKSRLDRLKSNIENTVGVTYEFIAIENKTGSFGICEAYNKGAALANYDVFCFMHEDIEFETRNWGQRVMVHLCDEKTGLIGVAGGDTKGWVPSSWSSYIFPSEVSLVQHFKNSSKPPERIFRTGYTTVEPRNNPVACLDGVWMCTRRDVYQSFRFDEENFSGFHAYDIDYSLQVATQYRVAVVFDIILHHFSEGSFDREWLLNAIKLSNKWKHQLPSSVRALSREDLVNQHWTAMRNFLRKLKELKFGRPYIVKSLLRYSFTPYFHLKHFLHFVRLICFDFKKL